MVENCKQFVTVAYCKSEENLHGCVRLTAVLCLVFVLWQAWGRGGHKGSGLEPKLSHLELKVSLCLWDIWPPSASRGQVETELQEAA